MKTVCITGSASGLGLALTQSFIETGWRVLATDINIDSLRRISAERGWPSDRVKLSRLDVTNPDEWNALQNLIEWLDVMINNAGLLKPGYVVNTTDQDLHSHIDINVKGVILGSRMAAKVMQGQTVGHIINIASLAAIAPVPGIALYSASKFAVRGFSLALAQELRRDGIYVTVVCPDAIQTPMLDLQLDYEEAAMTFSGQRSLTPAEVVQTIHQRVLVSRPLEVLLPASRGLLAKLVNLFPELSILLAGWLKKKGQRAQSKIKGKP